MRPGWLLALAAIGVVSSIIGAVTGSNSLITVPVMLLAGMEAQVAVATNMLAVTFLSAGAAVPFWRKGVIPPHPTLGLLATAIPGGVAGALLALHVGNSALHKIISLSVLALVLFIVLSPR